MKIIYRYNGITARLICKGEDGVSAILHESKAGVPSPDSIQSILWNDHKILLTGPLVQRANGTEEGDAFSMTFRHLSVTSI